MKGTVGSYECAGHYEENVAYKSVDSSLYLYKPTPGSHFSFYPFEKFENAHPWMVRLSKNMYGYQACTSYT